MLETNIYHLSGKRHSGRAIKVRALDETSTQDNLAAAAKFAGPETTVLELRQKESRMGVKQFVIGISDPCADPMAADVKWKKVTPADFDEGLGKYFTAKDIVVLEALYREYHDVTKDELDKITGKALPVSED